MATIVTPKRKSLNDSITSPYLSGESFVVEARAILILPRLGCSN